MSDEEAVAVIQNIVDLATTLGWKVAVHEVNGVIHGLYVGPKEWIAGRAGTNGMTEH